MCVFCYEKFAQPFWRKPKELGYVVKSIKGVWWMPWRQMAMKDVA